MRSACAVRTRFILHNVLVGLDWGSQDPRRTPLGYAPVGWLGNRAVSVLDSGAEEPGFKSQPRRCQVTVLGKTVHTHRVYVHQAAKLVAALLRVERVTAGLAESNGSLLSGL